MKNENKCPIDLELDDAVVIAVGVIAIVGSILVIVNMRY